MFHENSNDNVDKDELRHEDEDDEEHGRNDGVDATVAHTVSVRVTVVLQCVLPATDVSGYD